MATAQHILALKKLPPWGPYEYKYQRPDIKNVRKMIAEIDREIGPIGEVVNGK